MRWLLLCLSVFGVAVGLNRWVNVIRQQAYENAQDEASLEKQRFIQRLDHELKNPLTAMQLALANLEEAPDGEKSQEIRAGMKGQILRINRLISDLRKLATLEKTTMEQLPVDIGTLLDEVTMVFHEETLQRHFMFEYDADMLPTIIGDRDLLQLAVFNLIDNARKFTMAGDTISLRASQEDDYLLIQVADTGRGIPEADIPHVCEDLYRSPDVQGIPGSGVGLAMVKSIVEQHGGSVSVASTYRVGTTVTLRIPSNGNGNV